MFSRIGRSKFGLKFDAAGMMKLTESQARRVGSKIHDQMHGVQLSRFVSADMPRMIRHLSRELERLQTEIRFLRGQ